MRLVSWGLWLFVMGVVFLSSSAFAATYYVSPSGNDSNAGALSSPFRTIQKCLNTVRAGDTCFINSGTYNEALVLNTTGTSAARITVQNYNGAAVTVSSGTARVIRLNGTIGYYTFSGLTLISNYAVYVGNKDYSVDLA